jgi:hypothetical protein
MTAMPDTARLDPDEPVPYTLTPHGYAALADDPSPVEPVPPADLPLIVCLCGSTRFHDEFRAANLRLTLAGQIVLSIGCDTKSDGDLTAAKELGNDLAAVKASLDDLHKRKIDLADYVLVLNVGGYIGESTRSEIAYARATGKPVRYLDSAADDDHDSDDEWGCQECGAAYLGPRPDDGLCPACQDTI